MSIRKALAKVLLFGMLTWGAMLGVPMRPDDIEELMNVMRHTKIEQVVKKDDPLN